MTPDDREFGELVGEVRAIGKQLVDMQASNSREHADVIRRLDGVRADLDKKVGWDWMREQNLPTRVNSLEGTRDEGKGAAKLVKIGQGAAALGLMLLTYFAAKGGV